MISHSVSEFLNFNIGFIGCAEGKVCLERWLTAYYVVGCYVAFLIGFSVMITEDWFLTINLVLDKVIFPLLRRGVLVSQKRQ